MKFDKISEPSPVNHLCRARPMCKELNSVYMIDRMKYQYFDFHRRERENFDVAKTCKERGKASSVDGKFNNHALYQLFRNFPLAKLLQNGSGCVNVGRNNVMRGLLLVLACFSPPFRSLSSRLFCAVCAEREKAGERVIGAKIDCWLRLMELTLEEKMWNVVQHSSELHAVARCVMLEIMRRHVWVCVRF